MGLTLPSAFTNTTIIKENWLFQLWYDDEAEDKFFGLSFYDTKVEGTSVVQYKGAVINSPSIRESIDLETSTASTSNVNLTVANFIDGSEGAGSGKRFSSRLLNGTNNYINRSVKIYIQPDDAADLSSCLLVYTGKLIKVAMDKDTINLNIIAQRPWDNIIIPTERTATNIEKPIVYGDYTPNAQNSFSTGATLFPMPKLKTDGDDIHFASPKAYGSGDTRSSPHYYDDNTKKFIIMGAYDDDSTTLDGDNSYSVDTRLERGSYYLRPDKIKDHVEWDGSNPEYAIDGNTSNTTSQTISVTTNPPSAQLAFSAKTLKISMPQIKGQFSQLKFNLKGSIQITDKTANTSGLVMYFRLADTTFVTNTSSNFLQGSAFIQRVESSNTGTFSTSGSGDDVDGDGTGDYTEINLFDFYSKITDSGLNLSDDLTANYPIVKVNSTSPRLSVGTIIKIDNELMRVVANYISIAYYGVERGYSYSTAATHSSGADVYTVDEGSFELPSEISLQASIYIFHPSSAVTATAVFNITDFYLNVKVENAISREPQATQESIENLKFLYSGGDGLTETYSGSNNIVTEIHEAHRDLLKRYTGYSTTPINWSSGTNLDGAKDWKIRYWILEATSLIEVLEKLQYEGGFIGRFNSQNVFQYIYIPDSPSTDETITIDDVKDINISTTDFGSLSTKMEIEYQKNPAESTYVVKATSTNSSARTDYNIQSLENIKNIKLDAYVSPTINTSGGTKNDCFYRYYDHILGTPRVIVETTVINPALMGIDVGDIIKFEYNPLDETMTVFGTSWDDFKFMVTDTTRSSGKLKITAREI